MQWRKSEKEDDDNNEQEEEEEVDRDTIMGFGKHANNTLEMPCWITSDVSDGPESKKILLVFKVRLDKEIRCTPFRVKCSISVYPVASLPQ